MPHDIIDNRTRKLAPEINNLMAGSQLANPGPFPFRRLPSAICNPQSAIRQRPP